MHLLVALVRGMRPCREDHAHPACHSLWPLLEQGWHPDPHARPSIATIYDQLTRTSGEVVISDASLMPTGPPALAPASTPSGSGLLSGLQDRFRRRKRAAPQIMDVPVATSSFLAMPAPAAPTTSSPPSPSPTHLPEGRAAAADTPTATPGAQPTSDPEGAHPIPDELDSLPQQRGTQNTTTHYPRKRQRIETLAYVEKDAFTIVGNQRTSPKFENIGIMEPTRAPQVEGQPSTHRRSRQTARKTNSTMLDTLTSPALLSPSPDLDVEMEEWERASEPYPDLSHQLPPILDPSIRDRPSTPPTATSADPTSTNGERNLFAPRSRHLNPYYYQNRRVPFLAAYRSVSGTGRRSAVPQPPSINAFDNDSFLGTTPLQDTLNNSTDITYDLLPSPIDGAAISAATNSSPPACQNASPSFTLGMGQISEREPSSRRPAFASVNDSELEWGDVVETPPPVLEESRPSEPQSSASSSTSPSKTYHFVSLPGRPLMRRTPIGVSYSVRDVEPMLNMPGSLRRGNL